MNKEEKLDRNYKAQTALFPEKRKEERMILSLRKVVPQLLAELQLRIANIDDLDEQFRLLAKELDEMAEVLQALSLKYNVDLGVNSFFVYMLTYHQNLIQLCSGYSKYKGRFEDLILYIEYHKIRNNE